MVLIAVLVDESFPGADGQESEQDDPDPNKQGVVFLVLFPHSKKSGEEQDSKRMDNRETCESCI